MEGMPKFDLDELLSFEEVRLRAAHDCELTRVCRPCVSRCCERRSPPWRERSALAGARLTARVVAGCHDGHARRVRGRRTAESLGVVRRAGITCSRCGISAGAAPRVVCFSDLSRVVCFSDLSRAVPVDARHARTHAPCALAQA